MASVYTQRLSQVSGTELGEDAPGPFDRIGCGRLHGHDAVSLTDRCLVILIRHPLLRPNTMTERGESPLTPPVKSLRAPDCLAGVLGVEEAYRVLGGARRAPRRSQGVP